MQSLISELTHAKTLVAHIRQIMSVTSSSKIRFDQGLVFEMLAREKLALKQIYEDKWNLYRLFSAAKEFSSSNFQALLFNYFSCLQTLINQYPAFREFLILLGESFNYPELVLSGNSKMEIDLVLLCAIYSFSAIIYFPSSQFESYTIYFTQSTHIIRIYVDCTQHFHLLYPIQFISDVGFCQSIVTNIIDNIFSCLETDPFPLAYNQTSEYYINFEYLQLKIQDSLRNAQNGSIKSYNENKGIYGSYESTTSSLHTSPFSIEHSSEANIHVQAQLTSELHAHSELAPFQFPSYSNVLNSEPNWPSIINSHQSQEFPRKALPSFAHSSSMEYPLNISPVPQTLSSHVPPSESMPCVYSERLTGRLKFFDEYKKYGFFVVDKDNSDLFVHYEDFRRAGFNMEYINSIKGKTSPKFAFNCVTYHGKHSLSKKAINIENA